jgi:hypothetical protein
LEGQTTQPSTVIVDQVLTEGIVFMLFDGEQDNGSSDALLPVEEKERLRIFEKVSILY